ncbi:retrovirus-related pol polyprotein from transposon TNT 1-94 [Tanacetum coccineum]|uniref:Retrovirus-related pol polyprotein from transposon TNT 1-94 n=1 Tax=Tanacetum coccineum TaxID=301880 RepID=A0ABQ5IYT5_9ASTR
MVIKKLKEGINALSGKTNEAKIKQELEEIETINIELDHREKVLVITALKNDLRKLKGKALVVNDVTKYPSDQEMLKIDVEPITPKLLNKQTAHSAYIKHTQEEATELLTNISKTCPSVNNTDEKLVVVTPKNKDKRVRFTEPVTSSGNTITKTTSTSNLVSNKPMLSSTGVKPSTSASGSQPSGNTKKDKIRQTPSSTQMNKVEAHPRKVKSSFKNKDYVVQPKGTAHVQHSKRNANFELKCVKCNGCMLSDNHDLCVLDFINNVNARKESKSVNKSLKRKVWKPTGKVITTTTEVPLKKSTALDNETSKPVVTLVYSRKPRKSKTNVPVSKSTVLKSVSASKKEPSKSWGSKVSDAPSSSLDECRLSKLFSVKFKNDHVAKILGYGDYQIRNVMISRVYYVEGLGHNLFFIGQFYDSNLEVAFRQHTCFIRNLEGVDLLTGSRGNNLYTLSLGDMMASSPICLLSKALKTKSWLWHRRLSHLNFGAINHLARHGLVRGLPKLKFEKDHLCSACAMGKSKKKPHKPKSEDTNQEKLYLLHIDLCGPMCVASINRKKYIFVIVDDFSRFTRVKFLRSKDKALNFIIKFLKMIQKVGISHETSVARSLQQNGVVERRNRTLIEAACTMLIYAKALLFLWAEAVATACYTQNRSNDPVNTSLHTIVHEIELEMRKRRYDSDLSYMTHVKGLKDKSWLMTPTSDSSELWQKASRPNCSLIGNVTILRVYYVEGLGHNLFSVGQFCDSNLEVAFRQHTCFIHNLEGVDLLTGSRGNNLYTLSLGDMMASSPICLLSKASKTKSWLWHRRLSHLNFGAINHLARHGLVRGLPKLKFEKDHLCSACAMGKSKKKPHKPKSEDTNQEKLYLLHMDLCGPMRVASINGKKYILVIVDDYSRFTWVKFLRSKDEAPDFIIKFLKMI